MRRAAVLLVLLVLACALAIAFAPVPPYASLAAGSATSDAVLLDRHGSVLQRLRIDPRRRQLAWTPLAEISPPLRHAVLEAEDHRFASHPGVDPLALGAVARELLSGQRLRGASTITMQLASLLAAEGRQRAPVHERGLAAKLAQMRDALAIERQWSKDQILEAYLNLVPFRGELVGVSAAAAGLFGKGPAGIGEAEAALLAVSIRAPSATAHVLSGRACHLLTAQGQHDACAEAELISQALPRSPLPMPGINDAPHLARQLLHRPGEQVRTTLDASLQRFAVAALRNRLIELQGRNVADGALVVLDNASGEVLAYVGSSAELSSAAAVDGVRALRQPGSTLKPFLYALAIDRQWLNAASVIDDAPFSLATPAGLYAPQDYEHAWRGPVSLRTALGSSLNTPAARTLDLAGVDHFLATLHALGLGSLEADARTYGVGLALGDGETRLIELANAYRTLANGGRWTPLRFLPGAASETSAGVQVFSPGASFVIADILADPAARAPTFGLDSALALDLWAPVKTGTSKGMRDNWAVGFTDRYTVAVWVGNFSGQPMWDVSGVSGAAPLWRDLVLHLHESRPSRAPAPPPGVYRQRVRYQPAIEAERDEWFIAAAGGSVATPAPRLIRLKGDGSSPRFHAPADQAILAPDPDIPAFNQKVLVDAAGPANACLRLDDRAIAPCGTLRRLLPLPGPGYHRLELRAADGLALARSTFEVRGLPAPPAPQAGH